MTGSAPPIAIRRLAYGDLDAALALQGEIYPSFLIEDAAPFASRLDLVASYSLAATCDDVLAGYLLAHGWPRRAPPPVGAVLARDLPNEVLYLHDLAVAPGVRGLGIGRQLVERAFTLAAADGLRMAELVAVAGAAPFWRAFGFVEPAVAPPLARKVAAYGHAARWMERSIGPGTPAP